MADSENGVGDGLDCVLSGIIGDLDAASLKGKYGLLPRDDFREMVGSLSADQKIDVIYFDLNGMDNANRESHQRGDIALETVIAIVASEVISPLDRRHSDERRHTDLTIGKDRAERGMQDRRQNRPFVYHDTVNGVERNCFFGRVGGDEFEIVASGYTAQGLDAYLNTIKRNLDNDPFLRKHSITAGIGVRSGSAKDYESLEEDADSTSRFMKMINNHSRNAWGRNENVPEKEHYIELADFLERVVLHTATRKIVYDGKSLPISYFNQMEVEKYVDLPPSLKKFLINTESYKTFIDETVGAYYESLRDEEGNCITSDGFANVQAKRLHPGANTTSKIYCHLVREYGQRTHIADLIQGFKEPVMQYLPKAS
jgi:hypothetical protein